MSGIDLAAGATSCTVTVAVTSTVAGVYSNGAANVTTILNAPDTATLTVTAPSTITVRKNVMARVAASDQFVLGLRTSTGTADLTTATTTGSATGVQAAATTPYTATPGQTYTIREAMASRSASALSAYTSAWQCANGTEVLSSGTGATGTVTVPAASVAGAAGRYAAAIAQRFDLVGLEVFNEFNHERFNKTGCGTAPTCYVPLLQTVHDNVRAVDPDLPLVAGSTANYDAAWFDGLWQAGGMTYADAASYHPYQIVTDPAALGTIITTSRESMQTYGGGTLPIWITELGSTSTGGMPSQLEQAEFAFKASITAFGNGVEKFFWYDLINDSPDPTVHEGNFGLFGQPISGVTALPPKPVAMTVALVITHLADREAAAAEPLSADVLSYAFGDGEERTTFAWAPAGATTVQMPATGDVEVTAVSGQVTTVTPVDGVAAVPVSEEGVVVRVLP